MSYQADRAWSDNYIDDIRKIVGPRLLVPASLEQDTKQAADLIVLHAKGLTVAARVRRPGFQEKYPHDFTIRSSRENGSKTELAKLIDGWGDWMFYGHASASLPGVIERWALLDLREWRACLLRDSYESGWLRLARQKSNGDGTKFFAFDLRDFLSCVIDSSHPIPSKAHPAINVAPKFERLVDHRWLADFDRELNKAAPDARAQA